jgi:hypothetical protein
MLKNGQQIESPLVTAYAIAVVLLIIAGKLTVVHSDLRVLSHVAKLPPQNYNSRIQEKKSSNSLFREASSSRTLPPFSPDVLEGYQSCADFEADVVTLMTASITNYIQVQKDSYYCDSFNETYYKNATTSFAARTRRAQQNETSYRTNSRVPEVEEAELIQSDGKYIYIANGDRIQVLDFNGKLVANATIPTPTPTSVNQSIYVDLNSIFIKNNTLTAIATISSCNDTSDNDCSNLCVALYYNFNSTMGNLDLMNQFKINTSGGIIRNIGGYIYIIELTYIYYFGDLWEKLHRCSEDFQALSAIEYQERALDYLNSKVNQYASDVVAKVLSKGASSSCTNVIRIFNETVQEYGITQVFSLGISDSIPKMTHPSIYYVPFFLDYARGYISNNSILFTGYSEKKRMSHLIKFTVRDSIIIPTSIGAFEGSFNNDFYPYSVSGNIDLYNGYYRIMRPVYNNTIGATFNRVSIVQSNNSHLQVVGKIDIDSEYKVEKQVTTYFANDTGFIVGTYWNQYYNESSTMLHVLNLASPDNPTIIAAQSLHSQLNNIYPIENGKYFISIDNGVSIVNSSGITTYLFQVMDVGVQQVGQPSEVILGQQGDPYWSSIYSEAIRDPHAFRYLSQSHKLIIPANLNYGDYYNSTMEIPGDFHGFLVYDIDFIEGVKLIGNVSHDQSWWCSSHPHLWCPSYSHLSMVFNDDLVTFMGNSIKWTSTISNLSTLKWVWKDGDMSDYY